MTTDGAGTAGAAAVAEFEQLLRVHDPALRSLAWRLVGGDLDDVLQDAYVKAFRSWPKFRHDAAVRTWLYRIVYTTSLNHLRGSARRSSNETAAFVRSESHVEDVESTVTLGMDLAEALDRLPPDQRTVVVLVDRDGWSYDDVREVVGIPAGTVASRLHRARVALRSTLDEGGTR